MNASIQIISVVQSSPLIAITDYALDEFLKPNTKHCSEAQQQPRTVNINKNTMNWNIEHPTIQCIAHEFIFFSLNISFVQNGMTIYF